MRKNFAKKGELLTTFLHQVPNDQDQVILDHHYTNLPITIALDKALTPNQNAQRYFKRYQKLKEAVKYLTDLIEETKATILYLESVETVLNQKLDWKKSLKSVKNWFKQALSAEDSGRKSRNENQNSIRPVMAKPSSMSDAITFKTRANL